MLKKYLIATTRQKILDFFISHPDQSFYGVELARKNRLSLGATNNALRDFLKDGILVKQKRGNIDLYSLKNQSPIIRQLKILSALLKLEPLIEELIPLANKIILYGSSSRGDNDKLSDIDIFVVTTNTDKPLVKEKIDKYQKQNIDLPKIQSSIKTTLQWGTLEDDDPTKSITLNFDASRLERLCDALGLYQKDFLDSLDRSEADHQAGRVYKVNSLMDLKEN